MNIAKKVESYISKHQLIQKGDTLIVGVSGGADSMMLIHYLYTRRSFYDIQLKVAHIHHGVRREADEERNYVVAWCKEREIPVFVHYCNIQQLAKEHKVSEEEIGRQERYNFFISLTNEHDKIAVAHHMNDQAETMLMHFFRGSGINGLGGIQARRGQIIRPLLSLTRQQVEAYCNEKQLRYCQDESNFTTVYTRNKIRLECIPYIEEHINPNIVETLYRQGELYQEANAFIEAYSDKVFEKCVSIDAENVNIVIEDLKKELPYMQKKVIYKAVAYLAQKNKDISHVHIQNIVQLLTMQTGKEVHLPYDIVAKRSYETIHLFQIKKAKITNYEYSLKMGINNIESLNMQIDLSICTAKTFEECKENMYTKYVDYDRIKDNLQLRTRQPGDYMSLGNGQKKLKKLLIDDKVPQVERDALPLIAQGSEIIWIIGSRMSSKYFITSKTDKILEIKIIKTNAQEGLC